MAENLVFLSNSEFLDPDFPVFHFDSFVFCCSMEISFEIADLRLHRCWTKTSEKESRAEVKPCYVEVDGYCDPFRTTDCAVADFGSVVADNAVADVSAE